MEECGIDFEPRRVAYTVDRINQMKCGMLVYIGNTDRTAVVLSAEHTGFCWATKDQCRTLLPPFIQEEFRLHGIFDLDWSAELTEAI